MSTGSAFRPSIVLARKKLRAFPRDTLGAGRGGRFRLKALEAEVWPVRATAKGHLMPLPRAAGPRSPGSGSGQAAPHSWEVERRVSAEALKLAFHGSRGAFCFLHKGYSPASQAS